MQYRDRTDSDARAVERGELSRVVKDMVTKGEYQAAFERASEAARQYELTQDGEGRALTLHLLGVCYRRLNDLPTALVKQQESYDCYEAVQDRLGMANALRAKSGVLQLLGRQDEAIRNLLRCRDIYREAGERAEEMRTLSNLSILHKQSGDIASSQALLFECLAFFEKSAAETGTDHTIDMAKALLNIASNYSVLENFPETVRFARRGIALFEAAGDRHSLSMAFCILGGAYKKQKDDETALAQFETALRLAEEVAIQWVIAIILDDISSVLIHLRRFDEAHEILERCLRINGADANRLVHGGNLAQMGQLYASPDYAGRDPRKALVYLEEARQIAEEQDTTILLTEVHEALASLHEGEGRFAEALESFRAYHAAQKRLFNEESDQRIKRLEIEKAQKEAEIAQLRLVELAEALADAERLRALADERARTDALTGLLNRRALNESLEGEFEITLKGKRPLAVALIDIDRFKEINDNLGHKVGDDTLRHVAELLRARCRSADWVARVASEERRASSSVFLPEEGRTRRSGDRVARYGGEEFAIVLPDTDLPSALALGERLRELVAAQEWTSVHPGIASVTISIGVSVIDGSSRDKLTDASSLIIEADKNLYRAKRRGRNRVVG